MHKRFDELVPGDYFRFPASYDHREDVDPTKIHYVVGPKFDGGRNEARTSLCSPRVYVPPDLVVEVIEEG